MKKSLLKASGVASLTVLTALATTSNVKAADTEATDTSAKKEVVILHTNDIHGRLEEEKNKTKETTVTGVAKLDTVYKEEKGKDNQVTYLLDAGDAFQGLPISNASKGEDLAEIMNKIGYDAMAVGNHEFDFSLEEAKKYKELLKFPILSVNTYVNDVRLYDTHTILDKDKAITGDELVVIGVTTPETATKTHPRNVEGVEFRDPISEVEAVIKQIEAEAKAKNTSYKNYVILAHLGNDATTKSEWKGSRLAEILSKNELLKDKNVIVIDGHSHTVENAHFGNVSYTQTGAYLNNIGKLSFKVGDNTAKIGLISAKDTTDITPNAEISGLVKKAKENFDKINSEVLVENNPVELNSDRENVRVRETNLGNLVADSLYNYGNNGGFKTPTDLAVFNGGGIRYTLPKDSKITKGDVIKVLPFGNFISQIEVSGNQIKEMFEHSLRAVVQKEKGTENIIKDKNGQALLEPLGGFLQVSGARVYYDSNLEAGKRVLRIEVLDSTTNNYVELDLNKIYHLVTNDYLAAGGDDYKMLGGARQEGPSVDEALAAFIKTVDLTRYKEINSNERLIPLSSEEFSKLVFGAANNKIPGQDLEDKENKTLGQDLENKVNTSKKVEAGKKLPNTGITTSSTLALGLVLGLTTLFMRRKQK